MCVCKCVFAFRGWRIRGLGREAKRGRRVSTYHRDGGSGDGLDGLNVDTTDATHPDDSDA